MPATAAPKQTFNIPSCPGIDRSKPFVRAQFGKRFAPPVMNAVGYTGSVCTTLSRRLAGVIGGNATESLKNEYHEKEVETVPANVGS